MLLWEQIWETPWNSGGEGNVFFQGGKKNMEKTMKTTTPEQFFQKE